MRSASAGQVVYAGNGIAGYERLVIVKHSGNLLSAYSFNGRILVNEQQTVRTGQSLAELTSRNVVIAKRCTSNCAATAILLIQSLIKPG